MKHKYIVKTNGYLSYQRSIPTDLQDHPAFKGKKLHKASLGTEVKTDEEIFAARMQRHNEFEALIANLRKANQPLLKARELAKEAKNFLKAYGHDPGDRSAHPLLTDEQNRNIRGAIDLQIDHSGMLDEAREFYNKKDFGEIDVNEDVPSHVQVADEAWKLLNLPKSESKNQTVLLSDCWGIYAEKKELDVQDRQLRKTFHRWNYFFDFVGDCVLTNEEIHERLDRYVIYREQCRKDAIKAGKKPSPSSSTIHKEIDMACAIINQVVKLHRLQIRIVKPDIQKRIREAAKKLKYDIEDIVDEQLEENFKKKYNFKQFITHNKISRPVAKHLKSEIVEMASEIKLAKDGDVDFAEAYSHLNKPLQNRLIKFYDMMIEECEIIITTKKKKEKIKLGPKIKIKKLKK